ncbi:hypothetical protein BDQ17DRAFT_1411915 [Cyathus striatus]|nr:hypothetical protein BDQ17DRAFT_1339364 [Cyathus striatus]KAF8996171.1 hypothetical protein BDQ17DRAFT_1411915 [Cyathus striatus]
MVIENQLTSSIRKKINLPGRCSKKHINNVDFLTTDVMASSAKKEDIRALFSDTNKLPKSLVTHEYEWLSPVTALTDDFEVLKVFQDVFECQYWLYTEMKVLHRNLRPETIKFQKYGNVIQGVLCDFSHAAYLQDLNAEPVPSSQQRKETFPFLAYDLLFDSKLPYLYRHELESLFYVLYFIITSYENGVYVPDSSPLNAWLSANHFEVGSLKAVFLLKPPSINPTSNFERLKDLAEDMKYNICKGHCSQTPFRNEDVIGKIISYPTFNDTFNKEMKRVWTARRTRTTIVNNSENKVYS